MAVTLFVDAEFFLAAARTVFLVGEIELEGRVAIFPSDALLVDLSFDSGLSRLCCNVAAVRRREDAEGDGDSGVKVQVDGGKCEAVSCKPFELLNKSKGNKKWPLASREEGRGKGKDGIENAEASFNLFPMMF